MPSLGIITAIAAGGAFGYALLSALLSLTGFFSATYTFRFFFKA